MQAYKERMAEALKQLNRLRGHSLAEWRVRGAQLAAKHAERLGWSSLSRLPDDSLFAELLNELPSSDGNAPVDAALLSNFRLQGNPSVFKSLVNPKKTAECLQTRFASRRAATIQRADKIVAGKFDLLGLTDLSFGAPIDWHFEPVADKRVPLVHWSEIDYLDPSIAGDKKIIWELNRHQYFLQLGQAYWYSADETYAQTFADHLDAWMNKNPPKLGINWASSLEVAFRSISWLWAFHLFKHSPALTPSLFGRALKFLYLHGRHLETYLSTYFSPNTHLTGEALGLYYLGAFLPEFRRAAHWRELGRSILTAELDRQVRPDGVYFEQTSYYHRYTTDFYLHFLILERLAGQAVNSGLEEKLTGLLDHMMYITMPDGTTPLFGDDDGGRLVPGDGRAANDFRSTLAVGAGVFARGDYKYVAGEITETALWLLGPDAVSALDGLSPKAPQETSRAFPDGGYYVMRDGWAPTANYLLVDCGPHGTLNCGHAHADALSIVVAAEGRAVLVDPGTYTYTLSADLRDSFRSSAAHNTLTVDGQPSSAPKGPFTWRQIAQPTPKVWTDSRRFTYFEGAHDGYLRLPSPALHTRSLLFLKGDYWIVRDRVITSGEHSCTLGFHYAPGANPAIRQVGDTNALLETPSNASGLGIFTFGAAGGVDDWRINRGWASSCYASREAAAVGEFSQTAKGTQEFTSFLLPQRAGKDTTQKWAVTVPAPQTFEVTTENGRDLLLFQNNAFSRSEGIVTDFAWNWLRFETESKLLSEFVLLDGRQITLDGILSFDTDEHISYFAAKCSGDQLWIELNACSAFTIKAPGKKLLTLNGERFALNSGDGGDGEAVFFSHGQSRVGITRPTVSVAGA